MMPSHSPIFDRSQENWHEFFFITLDLMHDDPEAARQAGLAMWPATPGAHTTYQDACLKLLFAFYQIQVGQSDQALLELNGLAAKMEPKDKRLVDVGVLLALHTSGQHVQAAEYGRTVVVPGLTPLSGHTDRLAIMAMTILGSIERDAGRANQALQYFYIGLSMTRALELTARTAELLTCIAEVAYLCGNLDTAESMLLEASSLVSQVNERWLGVVVMTLYAVVLLALHKVEAAYTAINTYLVDTKNAPSEVILHQALYSAVVASVMAERGDLINASLYSRSALDLVGNKQEKWLPIAHLVAGQLQHQGDDLNAALISLTNAIDGAEAKADLVTALQASGELAEIHATQENWQCAYEEHQRYHSIYSRLHYQATQIHSTIDRLNELNRHNQRSQPVVQHEHNENKHSGNGHPTEQGRQHDGLALADDVSQSDRELPPFVRLSNEIRPLLNAILGKTYRALAPETAAMPEHSANLLIGQRDFIHEIHQSVSALLGLTTTMTDVSLIESGQQVLDQVNFNLDSVLDDVSTMTGAEAYHQHLAFYTQIPKDLGCDVIGDPLRLAELLSILVKNAFTFTRAGDVVLSVKQVSRSYQQVQYEFVVRDTGVGMTESQVARLTAFFAAQPMAASVLSTQNAGLADAAIGSGDRVKSDSSSASHSHSHSGAGAGLAIARSLVQLMGGKIWVESQAGKGSAFHFTVNLTLSVIRARRLRIAPDVKKMRMLVVSDHAASGSMLAEMLSELTLDVVHAQSAERGLELVLASVMPNSVTGGGSGHSPRHSDHALADAANRLQSFGVVFIDLQTSAMDGVEFIRSLKMKQGQVVQGQDVLPRLVLVGPDGEGQLSDDMADVLPDGFLSKPVNKRRVVTFLSGLSDGDGYAGSGQRSVIPPRFDQLAVLVVDDNLVNQQVMTEQLQDAGITVHVAGNGHMALELLAKQGEGYFGLVFLDMLMPELNGLDTARMVRQDPRHQSLPLVAISSARHTQKEDRIRCVEAGMADVILKPVQPAALYQVLLTYCSRFLEGGANKAMTATTTTVTTTTATINPATSNVMQANPVTADAVPFRIAGVDVQTGMARMQGDKAFYVELLMRFCEEHGNVIEELRSGATTLASCERTAHSFKGVAALMGANIIRAQAEKLEVAYREHADPETIALLVAQCDEMWQVQLAELRSVFAREAERLSDDLTLQLDVGAMRERLQHCVDLLREDNAEAFNLLYAYSNQILVALGQDDHRQILRAVRKADFDAALEAVLRGARMAGYSLI